MSSWHVVYPEILTALRNKLFTCGCNSPTETTKYVIKTVNILHLECHSGTRHNGLSEVLVCFKMRCYGFKLLTDIKYKILKDVDYCLFYGILIFWVAQFMNWVKNMLECQNLYCQIWLKKSEYGRIWDESVFIYPKQFSKLH